MAFSPLPGNQAQRARPRQQPTLVIGSWQGDVGVVGTEKGIVLWRGRTGHELGTLVQDGERFYLPLGMPLSLHEEQRRATTEAKRRRVDRRTAEAEETPSRLECRRLADGSLLWTVTNWSLKGRLHIEVDGDTLLAASDGSTRPPDMEQIYALDTQTGAVRWSVTGSRAPIRPVQFLASGSGRTFLCTGSSDVPVQVVESHSGQELWSMARPPHLVLSQPRGALVAKLQHRREQEATLTVLRAEDGTEVCQIPFRGGLQALTDEGMVYVSSKEYSQPWVAAVDAASDGSELWRADGVRADTLALDGGHLYYACIHPDPHRPHSRDMLAEVGALDARTGAPLWSWHSPRSTAELLQLWGWKTLSMLVDSAKKSWRTVADFLSGSDYRATRWSVLSSEFSTGQWRQPYALHGANNALWLEARDGLVFVGTRLGLFALAGDHGHLCWHAVPDIDISFVLPALPPV